MIVKNRRYEVIGSKNCECGCGNRIEIRRIHLESSKKAPRFIMGHHDYGNLKSLKNGRTKINGCPYIYKPDHPNCRKDKYIKESRIMMEKFIERYLLPKEVVHHINGDIIDNRIENLILTNRADHIRNHCQAWVKNQKRGYHGRFTKEVMPHAQ